MNKDNKEIVEKRLQEGIKNNEFLIYLQPKFYAKTREVAGAEALVRWKQNDKILMPNEFIPILEEYNLVKMLDMYVLEEVCKTLKKWNECGYSIIPISINESRQHLHEINYTDNLLKIINKYKISPKNIELEMTETAVIQNVEIAKQTEQKLHKVGFIVSMDDFGVGYSSFSMLKNINIDVLKIDKSFFDDILENNRARIIIQAVINMCKKLNIITVAEGIEKVRQVEYLKQIGCDIIQGYVFEKPMKIKEFEEKYINNE